MKKRLFSILAVLVLFVYGCAQYISYNKEAPEKPKAPENVPITKTIPEPPPIAKAHPEVARTEENLTSKKPNPEENPEPPQVAKAQSLPECTNSQLDDCEVQCDTTDVADKELTYSQNACLATCIIEKKCLEEVFTMTLQNIHKKTISGHEFEFAYLDISQYQTTGNKNIKFTDNGWYAPSYSLPRSKLLDVNLNQKVKVKITANFEGELTNSDKDCTGDCVTTDEYSFSEFAIYIIDESDNKEGMLLLGSRRSIVQGNTQDTYKFTQLTVENTGDEIIVSDSTGFEISNSRDFKYVTSEGRRELKRNQGYGTVNPDQKWVLGINCHVNGEGYCKLEIKDVQVIN